ncbi:hypothetical protein [uncultured Rhodospira sp.]|uniref:hypothetical protein n=1 Tax=uncultured Rhodospira sp. TaxID=1936189 RepID=UPI002632D468|nr:hypothetical protein [uncultured Rhodospira sp.]
MYVLIRRSPANPTGPYRACIFDENVPWLYYRGTFTLARGGPYSPDHDALKAWCDNRLYFGETGLLEPTTAFTPRGYDHWETVCDLPESLVDR